MSCFLRLVTHDGRLGEDQGVKYEVCVNGI